LTFSRLNFSRRRGCVPWTGSWTEALTRGTEDCFVRRTRAGGPMSVPIDVGCLSALGRLWAKVKLFHPYLATRDIDWDAALPLHVAPRRHGGRRPGVRHRQRRGGCDVGASKPAALCSTHSPARNVRSQRGRCDRLWSPACISGDAVPRHTDCWAPATSFFNIIEKQRLGWGVARAGYIEWHLNGHGVSHRLVEPPLMITHDIGAWNAANGSTTNLPPRPLVR
jgi:hypothetical protein